MSKKFAAALKEARDDKDLDQSELAELLGVPNNAICRIETGQRSVSASEMLTLGLLFPNWFEVQVADLVTDLKADLAARLRQFLNGRSFKPTEFSKQEWLKGRLASLDDEETIIA